MELIIEEEKAAAAEAAKRAPEESEEKPSQQVSVPIPVDDPVPAADGVELEDTAATDGDVEEGENGS